MANWQSSEEIGQRFGVGPGRLMAYAERGNLACRRPAGGVVLFDADQVERLFPPRGANLQLPMMGAERGFGTLGGVKLGHVGVIGAPRPVEQAARTGRPGTDTRWEDGPGDTEARPGIRRRSRTTRTERRIGSAREALPLPAHLREVG